MSESTRKCRACSQSLPMTGNEKWNIFIEIQPPSQNVVSGNKGGYAARAKYKKYRTDYLFWLAYELRKMPTRIPDATGRRRVYITRLIGKGGRKYDRGNMIGGCKPLLDALTLSGLLIDDKEEFLEDHYNQVRGDKSGVLIEIEDMI